jgi:hypothetical protein
MGAPSFHGRILKGSIRFGGLKDALNPKLNASENIPQAACHVLISPGFIRGPYLRI